MTGPSVKNNARAKELLDRAWYFRNTDRLEEAQELSQEVASCFGLDLHDDIAPITQVLLKTKQAPPREVIDLLLLNASYARAQNQLNRAIAHMESIKELSRRFGYLKNFQLIFQEGLNFFAQANYLSALECFTRSERLAESDYQLLSAKFNMILCKEYLGYSFAKDIEPVVALSQKLPDVRCYFSDELDRIVIKDLWLKGDFGAIDAFLAKHRDLGVKTALYIMWLKQLPHFGITLDSVLEAELSDLVSSNTHRHLVGYRFRSVLSLNVYEDQKSGVRATQVVERLYLWVWKWLTAPDGVALERVCSTINVLLEKRDQQISSDDYFLLENALRWLAIFAGVSDEIVRRFLSEFSYPDSAVCPVLKAEKLILDTLRARLNQDDVLAKDTDEYLRRIISNKEYEEKILSVLSAIETKPDGARGLLAELKRSLGALFSVNSSDLMDGVQIDLRSNEIITIRNGQVDHIVGQRSLIQLLSVFAFRSTVPVPEVLRVCMNFSSYHPLVHDPRLNRMLSKANAMLGSWISLKRKDGLIQLLVLSGEISFIGMNKHVESLMFCHRLHDLLYNESSEFRGSGGIHSRDSVSAPEVVERQSASASNGEWITRQEFEKILGVSRATAVRRINEYLSNRLVIRKGRGKASRYKLAEGFYKELKNHEF